MRLVGLTLSILLGVLLLQVVTAELGKPGICPPTLKECLPWNCKEDSDCPGTKKCCETSCSSACQEPIEEVKPGTCPVVDPLAECLPTPKGCNVDSDCLGTMKCCKTSCSADCQEPIEMVKDVGTTMELVKPGICPFVLHTGPLCYPGPPGCLIDSHCPGTMKCCVTGCSVSCQIPIG
ncbi:WAP four-disulfide core domain protein 2-like isoform X1 [Lithobates pipiens]